MAHFTLGPIPPILDGTITLKLSELSPSAIEELIIAIDNDSDPRILKLKRAWDELTSKD